MPTGLLRVFGRALERRGVWALTLLALTVGAAGLATRVRVDFSVEQAFPRFDASRLDYERFKQDFPFDDARALVAVEAPDVFSAEGLARIQALERDLAELPGVVDTRGLSTVKDVVLEGDAIRMERLFPRGDVSVEELARRRSTATTDPLFAWNLAPPDGHATLIEVTLDTRRAASDAGRTEFLMAAREVITLHAERARADGVEQRLLLSGIPVIRAQAIELINHDMQHLFPLACLIVLALLYATFRSGRALLAIVATIAASVIWCFGAMGALGVPLQILTQLTPIVVLIISISDSVHVMARYREEVRAGCSAREATARSCADGAIPCLLTELTIAGGFLALVANDIELIQDFGAITALAMLLAWLANFTVLPAALAYLSPRFPEAAPGATDRVGFARLVGFVERTVSSRPRWVLAGAGLVLALSLQLSAKVEKNSFVFDDLRPQSQLAREIRTLDGMLGGSVPVAVYVEGKDGGRTQDAMLDPDAIALLDRITTKLETDLGGLVKSATSLSKYLRKAHFLLSPEQATASPLPDTRELVAQEVLLIDDSRALRDVLAADGATAAVQAVAPDHGARATADVIRELRAYLASEQARTGYRITLTGVWSIADGVYRSLVGGLLYSLAGAVLVSFVIFFAVLRSWQLAAAALIPNLLPLVFTFGLMGVLGIELKPSTVILFSITLVIADDDTILYMTRVRQYYLRFAGENRPDPHRAAALEALRHTGVPMFVTASCVALGFGVLVFSEFLALANLGILLAASLWTAVVADLFLSPLIVMKLRPRI